MQLGVSVQDQISKGVAVMERSVNKNGRRVYGEKVLKTYYKQGMEFPVRNDVFIAGYSTAVVEKALAIVIEVQNALERGDEFEVRLKAKDLNTGKALKETN